ncbi:MAG: hypothetical protein ACTTIR_06175 [Eggerthia catenaformis]|uniref:hypothetical protein n=1 Tax=Eggerthia catenaformis TaxID=31973 RepID=UPI003FA11DB1
MATNLRNMLNCMETENPNVAVKYKTADNIPYAFNGMPGALVKVLQSKILSANVKQVKLEAPYIVIEVEDPEQTI